MAVKLWTAHFMRIGIANLLLFASLYMLFPAIAIEMGDRAGISLAQTGGIFLCLMAGMFLIGPFHAYLVDAYKRKYVYMFASAAMVAATAGYAFVTDITELMLLSLGHGMAFGMATSSGITLAIDVTGSALRSVGNISFSWVVRLGMIIGVVAGVCVHRYYPFEDLVLVSAVTGAIGILVVAGVYVPFRAPIVTKTCSFDRFMLLRGWVLAVNLVLITFVPGLLVSLAHPFLNNMTWWGMEAFVPFFALTGAGCLLSMLLRRLPFLRERMLRLIVGGIGLEILAVFLLDTHGCIAVPAVLLGLGLGFVMPEFLLMFVKLSEHCQRGTANTTHLLASEAGTFIGIAASCRMDAGELLTAARVAAVAAMLFFVFVAYPYFRRKKIR